GAQIYPCACAPFRRDPGPGEDLAGPPAEQERVGALVDLVKRRRGLVVQQRPDPSAALESAAAVLVRPAESLHHSVDGDHRDGRQFHGRSSLVAEFCRRSIRPGRGADLIRRSRVNGDASSEPPTWCVRVDSSNISIDSCGRGMIRNDSYIKIILRYGSDGPLSSLDS